MVITLALVARKGYSLSSMEGSFKSNTLVDVTRRKVFQFSCLAFIPSAICFSPFDVTAAQADKSDMIDELKISRDKLAPIPQLLEDKEWEKVRNILKTPPVNKLWNLGESQNTLFNLAKESGDIDLLELKDELAISLQMCDQFTYDNAFVYYQPGTYM